MARKKRLFSGRITPQQQAANALNWALILARRAGIYVPPGRPRTVAGKLELVAWIYEEIEKRKPKPPELEPPAPPAPPEPPRPETPEEPEEPPAPEEPEEQQQSRERGENLRAALQSGAHGKDLISAIMAALTPEEQAKLRAYGSDDIIQIAETYAENPDLSMDEAIEMYYGQQEEFFENLNEDEVWGDYDDIF